MPAVDVDALEAISPGWIQVNLDDWSEEIEDLLRKRYAVPFVAPAPRIILRWLTKLTTADAYERRGWDPGAEKDRITAAAEKALAEIKEAADAKDGLFDLPLRADQTGVSGVHVGPMGSSQASPYSWVDDQAAAVTSLPNGVRTPSRGFDG